MADTSAQQSLGSESQGQQAGRGFESGQQPAPHATALQDYMNSAVDQTGKILKTMGQRVRSFADSVREEPGTQHHVRATAERVARKLESSAEYLAAGNVEAVRREALNIVQRYPLRTVGMCFAIGWVVGAATRRRGV